MEFQIVTALLIIFRYRKFKLHVCGNGKPHSRILLAEFLLTPLHLLVLISKESSYISLKIASSFPIYYLVALIFSSPGKSHLINLVFPKYLLQINGSSDETQWVALKVIVWEKFLQNKCFKFEISLQVLPSENCRAILDCGQLAVKSNYYSIDLWMGVRLLYFETNKMNLKRK